MILTLCSENVAEGCVNTASEMGCSQNQVEFRDVVSIFLNAVMPSFQQSVANLCSLMNLFHNISKTLSYYQLLRGKEARTESRELVRLAVAHAEWQGRVVFPEVWKCRSKWM